MSTIARRRPSVLVVEDERIIAKDLQQTLVGLGYDAFAIASSADEAIACASERCPDVVLMDVRIKGSRDGIEAAQILRREFGVPIVYLTAHADEATINRAKKTEPHGYLLKPVKSPELRSAIEVCLYRHEMEKRLRERERWFSTTLDSIADAVVAVDLSGKVTFMNAAAEALTGAKGEHAVGRPVRDFVHLMIEPPAPDETPLSTALREKRPVRAHEASLLNVATGARHWVSDSAAPVMDEDRPLGAVMVFRDVTEQRVLQKRIEVTERLASLGTMAASVAHEVNNPLTVIRGNADLAANLVALHRAELERAGVPASLHACLDGLGAMLADVQTAADRIALIVSDLRTFSRPAERGTGTVNLAQCVEWAVRSTSHEFQNRARFSTHLGEVPEVAADEGRLGQVLINLLVNAAQSISPGNASQNEVSVTASTDDRGWVVLEVRDTGCGIPKELRGRIFEPFFTTKEAGVGTGLGLSISHGIVASFGGELTLQPEDGKGTRFLISLPPAPRTHDETRATPQVATTRRGRILVVDDETMVLRVLERVLVDHEVVLVGSAEEALTLLERDAHFDVVLSDLVLPTMTGMAFYETLLSRNPDLARHVIFMSGGAVTKKLDAFLGSVQNSFVEKPFDRPSLLRTVQEHLAARAAVH